MSSPNSAPLFARIRCALENAERGICILEQGLTLDQIRDILRKEAHAGHDTTQLEKLAIGIFELHQQTIHRIIALEFQLRQAVGELTAEGRTT